MDKPNLCDLSEELFLTFEYIDGKLFKRNKTTGELKCSGYINNIGYRVIKYGGARYLEHRVIYYMFHGVLPCEIDHIDKNPLNNRIENLRACTRSQNLFNARVKKNNKCGHKNVYWDEENKLWRVQVKANKRKFTSSHKTLEDAIKSANKIREKVHGEFASE